MPFINSRGIVSDAPSHSLWPIDDIEAIDLSHHSAIGLNFDNGNDGRAFSACALVRSAGFTGVVVGTGAVGLDRIAYAFRVGFDLVWLSESDLARLADIHLTPFPAHYQPALARSEAAL